MIIVLITLFLLGGVDGIRFNRIHIEYPLDLHYADGSGHSMKMTSTRDKLTCFGNRDYAEPTVMETLGCITLGFLGETTCTSLWGSRSLSLESNSSLEFYRSTQYRSLDNTKESISMRVQRWLHLEASVPEFHQVPAEPFYLCARSNDWRADAATEAEFSVFFRSAYIRYSDRYDSLAKVSLHGLLVVAMSNMWLLPYVVALATAVVAFTHGMSYFILVMITCILVLLLFPLMLRPTNLHMARLYLKYFFTQMQAQEARQMIRQRLPLFQATFFSAALCVMGSITASLAYTYCDIGRENRNLLIQTTLSLSAAWFVFFVCRSFERFCHDWFWVVLSVTLANRLEIHVNPSSHDRILMVSLLINFTLATLCSRVYKWLCHEQVELHDQYEKLPTKDVTNTANAIPEIATVVGGTGETTALGAVRSTAESSGNSSVVGIGSSGVAPIKSIPANDSAEDLLHVVSRGLGESLESVFLDDDMGDSDGRATGEDGQSEKQVLQAILERLKSMEDRISRMEKSRSD